jgi:hypothetical protein
MPAHANICFTCLLQLLAKHLLLMCAGVSGRFAHSQLHAIMGPSGCGKTSLCKALARRLPANRVLGDIRVLCSSAADGYKSESELAVCGHKRSAAKTKCDLAYMTGYVPQFDLLHESLTVRVGPSLLMSYDVLCYVILCCVLFAVVPQLDLLHESLTVRGGPSLLMSYDVLCYVILCCVLFAVVPQLDLLHESLTVRGGPSLLMCYVVLLYVI